MLPVIFMFGGPVLFGSIAAVVNKICRNRVRIDLENENFTVSGEDLLWTDQKDSEILDSQSHLSDPKEDSTKSSSLEGISLDCRTPPVKPHSHLDNSCSSDNNDNQENIEQLVETTNNNCQIHSEINRKMKTNCEVTPASCKEVHTVVHDAASLALVGILQKRVEKLEKVILRTQQELDECETENSWLVEFCDILIEQNATLQLLAGSPSTGEMNAFQIQRMIERSPQLLSFQPGGDADMIS